jgi:hypothetical protein
VYILSITQYYFPLQARHPRGWHRLTISY